MLNISNLKDAYETLASCYNDYQDNADSPLIEYIEDSCIKRFEYTLETAWKLTKKLFIQKYGKTEQELSMNNIFRFMQGYGLAEDWERWRNYYQKRNETAQEYNLKKARSLLVLIPDFIKDVEYLIDKLNEELHAD